MNGRRSTRRSFIGMVVGGVALLGLGRFNGTLAAPVGEGSKETFKEGCEKNDGTFVDSPKDNLTACFYSDGSKHVCNTNGSECRFYLPPKKSAAGGNVPFDEITGFPELVSLDPATSTAPEPGASESGTKKHRRHGKRRKN